MNSNEASPQKRPSTEKSNQILLETINCKDIKKFNELHIKINFDESSQNQKSLIFESGGKEKSFASKCDSSPTRKSKMGKSIMDSKNEQSGLFLYIFSNKKIINIFYVVRFQS